MDERNQGKFQQEREDLAADVPRDDRPAALSPLADPVVAAIFSDIENAGLAAASLTGAVLAQDGARIGNVLSVTPQRHYSRPGERGCRIDIEVVSDRNERVIIEVQMQADRVVYQRNLFSASRIFAGISTPGSASAKMAATMPRVIAIDILNFNMRDDQEDFLQPIKPLYTKAPHVVAFSQFAVYSVQLPRFRETEKDFGNPLHCWLYAMDTAAQNKLSIEEVIKMSTPLQQFADADAGFRQFCERYKRVAADPKTRNEYYDWIHENMREQGMLAAAREEGELRKSYEVARNFLNMGLTPEQVAKGAGLPLDEVMELTRTETEKQSEV
jgi:predicted transposase/invertase (TIGR01784 family)